MSFFQYSFHHCLVVTSGYLSYCCLSIISNQSVHSPLTSDINKAFSSTQLPLTGYFLFFWPFSGNPSLWNTQTSPSDTNNHSTFSHLNPLSSPFWCSVWTFSKSSSPTSRCLNPEMLPCDWLISNLCYQAIEQVYLIKWPVSVYL